MTKITSDMRRMVNDPEFFAVVKAMCEAQDMMRNYHRKHLSMRRQRYHDNAFRTIVDEATAADGAPPVTWERKASLKPTKPTLHD